MVKTADRAIEKFRKEIRYDNRDRKTFVARNEYGGTIKPEIGYHIRKDMQRKGYAKESASAVRDWIFTNTPFNEIFSYMKYTNEASAKSAVSWGCHQVDEFEDEENEITKVFAITRSEWEVLTKE